MVKFYLFFVCTKRFQNCAKFRFLKFRSELSWGRNGPISRLPSSVQTAWTLSGAVFCSCPADWRYRHAGLMAISAVGEGCHKFMEEILQQVVDAVLPFLVDPVSITFMAYQCKIVSKMNLSSCKWHLFEVIWWTFLSNILAMAGKLFGTFWPVFFSLKHFGHLSSHSCKLAITVFIIVYFQTFWLKWLNTFGHLKNISVYDRKKNPDSDHGWQTLVKARLLSKQEVMRESFLQAKDVGQYLPFPPPSLDISDVQCLFCCRSRRFINNL